MADTPLTDEYVANLLAKDAKDSSIKYSSLGMEAFLPSKVPANKPKPNTRFLRNIIKETDNHNAALLAKEAADSKARLATLEVKKRPAAADIRRRQLGHITAHLMGGSSRRGRGEEIEKPERPSRRRNSSSEGDESKRETKYSSKSSAPRRHERGSERGAERVSSRSHKRRRSRSPDRNTKRHRSRSRSRSRSWSRSRSPSPRKHRTKESRHRHRSPHRSSRRERHGDETTSSRDHRHSRRSPPPQPSHSKSTSKDTSKRLIPTTADSDSDPLDAIIGPRPPPAPTVRSRGRGVMSSASGIDQRFAANYDPQSDVALDFDEENDWEQALEALRDRRKWQAQGAERLRAAGFTEAQVEKWEKGDEKREEDVIWAKKGEGREWDRGKVVGEGGIFSGVIANDSGGSRGVNENWGRLKDT